MDKKGKIAKCSLCGVACMFQFTILIFSVFSEIFSIYI